MAGETRRSFLKKSAALAALMGTGMGKLAAAEAEGSPPAAAGNPPREPWYRRTLRWGQTNINELDPTRYDIRWWREQWRRTRTQGIVVNAGGIVAYYPTEVPFHRRARFLGSHDLFGDLTKAAREEGIVVFARMDSGGNDENFYRAHPDWFATDAEGRPYRREHDLYMPCLNGPYYGAYLNAILKEVAARYKPEGFTDNYWSSWGRNTICYCPNCTQQFRAKTGQDLPRKKDWNDPTYRHWIEWAYACRLRVWDENNRLTREVGGPDCVWVGMNGGSPYGEAQQFRDFRAICQRTEILMLDDQRRANATGFQRNAQVGKLVHGVLGWDKVAPESMAMYQTTAPTFRQAAKPPAEARLWMIEGFAGGIQPWWHYLGAYGEDRRSYQTPVKLCQWHAENEAYLVRRRPVASVGIVWSQRSSDFFGRDDWQNQASAPADGFMQALVRARIPTLPVHLDDLEREAPQLKLLVLPNIGAMTEAQAASIRRFVQSGGGLLATGQTSLCDEWGDPRADFALADLFGAHLPANAAVRAEATRRRWAEEESHTYLRLVPELRRLVDGPHIPGEPLATGPRHPALRGFDQTDILAFGGTVEDLQLDPGAKVLATFIPPYPVSPPEDDWMRTPRTNIPALIVNEQPGRGRVAYLPADLDRRYDRNLLPDHGDLLANLARWAAREDMPLKVEGPGLVDCNLYRQPGRAILHLVNLTNAGTWRAPVDELIPVGPLRVAVRLPDDVRAGSIDLRVSGRKLALDAA
ncbi:MAG TPA: alpha-amylase family protein, partial [Opitutaceae bacterium]|nr:alpha-amylase family protein [Opitutaceae bacterium]